MDDSHGRTGLAFPMTLFLMQAFILVIWVLYGSYAPGMSSLRPSVPPSLPPFLPNPRVDNDKDRWLVSRIPTP